MKRTPLVLAALLALGALPIAAQTLPENVFYVGGGHSAESTAYPVRPDQPATLGFLRMAQPADTVWGMDFAKEGSMVDRSWGQDNVLKPGRSLNLLVGKNLQSTDTSRIDLMLVAGVREATASCVRSQAGYQCRNNAQLDHNYQFNYGALLTVGFDRVLLGVRLTSVSQQLVVGWRF
jgi:hypothetical protein